MCRASPSLGENGYKTSDARIAAAHAKHTQLAEALVADAVAA
jgi:hypothetical protein